MIPPRGKYKTEAGSEVEISEEYAVSIDFNRHEEDACEDCVAHADFEWDNGEYFLCWYCDYCGGGMAKLIKINGD